MTSETQEMRIPPSARISWITAGLAVCLLTAVTAFGKETDKVVKRDRYLVLDSRIIESTENVKLTVGTVRKDKNNPLLTEDRYRRPG